MSTIIKQLSAMDAAFLYQETAEVPMHVGSITVFKLPDGYTGGFYETFKQRIAERLHLAPILKWKLQNAPFDLDHPSWVEDEQFNIDRHVFRGSLPEPRNRATAERIAGWIHAKLLNRARPLWEMHVYEGLENDELITYMKIHHACIDGGAGQALMQILYDVTREPGELPAPPAVTAPAVPAGANATAVPAIPDMGSKLFNSYMQMWQQPLKLMTRWPEMLKALPPLLTRLADPRALGDLMSMASPPTPLNRAISSERSFACVTLSLSRVKAIAAAAGGKVNDVVMALSSGILRRYLLELNALPAQSLTAMIPISLREKGDAEANNQVMAMINPLATNIEDPKARLAQIISESTKAKEMVNPFKALIPLYTSGATPIGAPIAVQIFAILYSRSNLANVLTPMANVVISNVAGSREPLYAAGAEMLHLYPVSIPAHGLGLNITVQSYLDNLDFGLIAGANIISDVRHLTDMLPLELDTLEKAYGIAQAREAGAIA